MPIIIGTNADDSLVGSLGSDTIVGGDGNDLIDDGNGGPDELIGGRGNDTYYIRSPGSSIVEFAGEGIDTVRTNLGRFTLASNIERLVYFGAAGSFSGTGNSLDNLIIGGIDADTLDGGAGDDVLSGLDGNDILIGGGGINTLVGGAGNDLYFVDNVSDSIVELAGEGSDRILTALANFTLPSNVENLTHTGSGTFFGNGNALDNVIAGGGGEDFLFGLDGNDTLVGGAGPDKLYGGLGNNVMIGGLGNDIYFVSSSGDTIVEAVNDSVTNTNGTDYVYFSTSIYRQPANTDFLIFNGTGGFTAYGWNIRGGAGDDTLYFDPTGYSLNLTINDRQILAGGAGNDTYYLTGGAILEHVGEGNDVVFTTLNDLTVNYVEEITFTGTGNFILDAGSVGSIIRSGAGDDRLYGQFGADTIFGGGGNDVIDGDWYFDLSASTGSLFFADGSIDTLYGGAGNDTYIIREATDVIVELAGEGTDTVRTALSSYTLPDNVEQLFYIGTANISASGNAVNNSLYGASGNDTLDGAAGDDTLVGFAGNDILTGGSGANALIGGTGDDIYFTSSGLDSIIENAGEGNDVVRASGNVVNFTLGTGIENFEWVGTSGGANVTGNSLDNVIVSGIGTGTGRTISGLDGNDTLSGGSGGNIFIGGNGNDRLTGGAGTDQFRYLGGETGSDTIIGFTSGVDKIVLSRSFFTPSATVDFIQGFGLPPTTTNSTFLYDNVTGNLFYDDDGTGAFPALLIANIGAGLTLAAGDFIFF